MPPKAATLSERDATIAAWKQSLEGSHHSDTVLEAMRKVFNGINDLAPEDISAAELTALEGLGKRIKADRDDLRIETNKLFQRKFGPDPVKEDVPVKLLEQIVKDGTELIDGK